MFAESLFSGNKRAKYNRYKTANRQLVNCAVVAKCTPSVLMSVFRAFHQMPLLATD